MRARDVHRKPEPSGARRPRRRQDLWQIRSRWFVAPAMIAGLLAARALGIELSTLPVVLIAASTVAYNAAFAWVLKRHRSRLRDDPQLRRALALLEVVADYLAVFGLIYFTGGVSSPLVVVLIFHVIISTVQLPRASAYQLAGLAAGGLWLMFLGQIGGWIALPRFAFAGEPLTLVDRPVFEALRLFFFSSTLFITVAITARIMGRLRYRMAETKRVYRELVATNERLNGLYTMITTIGAERRLEVVLADVTAALSKAVAVPAVAIKLLDDDERQLRLVAAHGLPEDWPRKVLHIDRSPLNRRCIEGETLVSGSVEGTEPFELRQELENLGFHSAVLAPLRLADRVIGTLSFYSPSPRGFSADDAAFLELAGELVAIAIDNARAYEAIERILHEQASSMLEVAHNLRAPLGAGLSMLKLLQDGYLGGLSDKQAEHLTRLADRLSTLDQTIGELLTIARSRDRSREIRDVEIDLAELARQTETTFREEAAGKGVRLEVETDAGLPAIPSGGDLLHQILHNLVSNAIKYTPEGGEVVVRVSPRDAEGARIMVRDTGIGIPAEEQERLFQEFFRASNAKRVTTQGTGLGLALVKRAVERHRGQVRLASQVGEGTTVVVDLPGGHPDNRRPDLS